MNEVLGGFLVLLGFVVVCGLFGFIIALVSHLTNTEFDDFSVFDIKDTDIDSVKIGKMELNLRLFTHYYDDHNSSNNANKHQ